jgi:uncharacterized protein YpiB (UPF0302 family)
LSVFEQSNFTDDSRITKKFIHNPDIEEVELITSILHHSGTDPEERRLIDTEKEAWRTVNAMFENQKKAFEKALTEKEKALTEKEKALTEKDKALTEKDKIIEELRSKLEGK